MMRSSTRGEGESARRLRAFVLALLVLGQVGVLAELIVLNHFEDSWQLVPFVLIGLGLGTIVWYLCGGGVPSLRLLQGLMVLFVVAGAAGIVLHYRGNLEFQLDIDASQHGWALFKKVIHAKAPPALAPGAMAQLGLLGLTFTFRHPGLKPSAETELSS
jgi:hypothetical protein